MPEVTTASAISRISLSLTSHPNLFQLFHPIGGVAAIDADCAWMVGGNTAQTSKPIAASARKATRARKQDFRAFTSITYTPSWSRRLYSVKESCSSGPQFGPEAFSRGGKACHSEGGLCPRNLLFLRFFLGDALGFTIRPESRYVFSVV